MSGLRRLTAWLDSTDILLVVFWFLLSTICFVFKTRVPFWWLIILANLSACILVGWVAWSAQSTGSRTSRWVHDWAAFPLVVFTYKQLYFMVGPMHLGKDYDRMLITIDRWLFGADPTKWLIPYANPYLTEILQIAYSLFYVLFIAVAFELYQGQTLSDFRYFRFTFVYGFFLSYIGYFFLPAVGPRFTLHDFSRIDTDLPGTFATHYLRWAINLGESIPAGVSNSMAMAAAQRDVFPSGHAMMTLAAIILAFRFKLRVRYFIAIAGILLIVATVYLRYHYAIDVLAGAFLIIPCLLTSRRLSKFIRD